MKMMICLDINFLCAVLKLLPISNPLTEPWNTTTNVSRQSIAHDHENELITAS